MASSNERGGSRQAWLLSVVFLAYIFAGFFAPLALAAEHQSAELENGFLHPPDSARPWVYWFWIDGNITRAGITQDLEAMSRVGIGGALLMDVTQDLPHGPVKFGSSEWMDLFQYAVTEAGRLGLELSVNNSGGWSGSGGPWISPSLAMQKVVSSKTNLVGPLRFHAALPQFAGVNRDCQPFATIAFPALGGEGGPLAGFPPERVTVNGAKTPNGANLFDGNPATFVAVPLRRSQPQFLQLEFAQSFTAADLKLVCAKKAQKFQGKLQVSNNGREFRDVRDFSNTRATLALSFEQTSARFFRLVFDQADPGLAQLEFSECELGPVYRIPWYQSKSGAGPMGMANPQTVGAIPSSAVISSKSVVDLTPRTDQTGALDWDVPNGPWTIIRFAYAPIGTENHTASEGGLGLECDKLSREAVEKHFQAFVGRLLDRVGSKSALTATHIDSWEIGFQNGTPGFLREFQARRGYDPLPYLPALTGRYVEGDDQSERFLWDVRRTIADLVADNYAGHFADLAHQHGLKLSVEAYASLGKGPFDDLRYAARADIPMAEFWFGTNDLSKFDLRPMPSAGHAYGKPIAAAEAFTSEPAYAKWQEHPFALKPLADAAFCEGINRLVFHRFAHQPWTNRAPGMTLGPFGIHYERTQTWWEQSRPWHEYLSRCQYLLQRGLFVADLCYMTSEGSFTRPPGREQLNPPPPAGYNYDLVSPDVVLKRMAVKDGQLLLPDGVSYRVLILPDDDRMSPELLRKLTQLVQSGATVVGRRPIRSPGLSGYPQCDTEVKGLAGALWGACDGQRVRQNAAGKGTIIWGEPLTTILNARGLAPDFVIQGLGKENLLHWIHRRIGDVEVYFVSNPTTELVTEECEFRVSDKRPEFWHADSGEIERPAVWRQPESVTMMPLRLEPFGSVFVMFRGSSIGGDPVSTFTCDGRNGDPTALSIDPEGKIQFSATQPGTYVARLASGKTLQTRIESVLPDISVAGKWEVHFPPASGAPERVTFDGLISWSTHSDPGVKYFSGTAVYEKSIEASRGLINPDRRFLLDLGRVKVIAELKVNGIDFGVLWKPPFVEDITRAVQPGKNTLEIKVVNLWPNRLIGDEQLPEDCKWKPSTQLDYGYGIAEWPDWLLRGKPSPAGRLTFTTWKHWNRTSPLLESGLLGPVTLRVLEHRILN